MHVTLTGRLIRDWTYREACRRLVRAGRARLRQHGATPGLDDDGNRVVQCGCGWRGNAIGWSGHLDSVVCVAVDEDLLP